jgi:hypothetical protein
MTRSPERQWHASELVEELEDLSAVAPTAIDKYALSIILSRCEELASMGRMVFALKEASAATSRGRIDLIDACETILRQASGPLTTAEIRAGLSHLRGTGEFFFIQPTQTMVRVAPDTWGLVQRDFMLSRLQIKDYLQALRFALEKTSTGLHVSELPAMLPSYVDDEDANLLTSYMAMSISQISPDFRVHRGQIVALAEWGEPRRRNIRSAFLEYAQGRSEIDTRELRSILSELVGRPVSAQEASSALQQNGWRYREKTVWVREEPDDGQLILLFEEHYSETATTIA